VELKASIRQQQDTPTRWTLKVIMAQKAAQSVGYAAALCGAIVGAGAMVHFGVTTASMVYPSLPISAGPDTKEIFGDEEPVAVVPDSARRVLVRQVGGK
jgi:hypothetical protein